MESASPKQGSITLYTGPMKSGKSEELLNKLNRAHYEKTPYIAFRPHVPKLSRVIKARNLRFRVTARHINPNRPELMARFIGDCRIIAVDEAQFFQKSFNDLLLDWYRDGRKVYLTALDTTFDGEIWPIVSQLKMLPEVKIQNRAAVCELCGQRATRTFKKPDAPKGQVLIGDGQFYQARCYHCWSIGQNEKKSA